MRGQSANSKPKESSKSRDLRHPVSRLCVPSSTNTAWPHLPRKRRQLRLPNPRSSRRRPKLTPRSHPRNSAAISVAATTLPRANRLGSSADVSARTRARFAECRAARCSGLTALVLLRTACCVVNQLKGGDSIRCRQVQLSATEGFAALTVLHSCCSAAIESCTRRALGGPWSTWRGNLCIREGMLNCAVLILNSVRFSTQPHTASGAAVATPSDSAAPSPELSTASESIEPLTRRPDSSTGSRRRSRLAGAGQW
jgi:hypothetical protein